MKGIAGLLLAAGASSRMGVAKQLLPWGGSCLLQHVLEQALSSDLAVLSLILGHRAEDILERIRPALQNPKLRIIRNPRFAEGISTSILAGIQSIEKEYDHVLILLGDMPWITSALLDLLIAKYLRSGLSLGAIRTRRGRSLPVIVGRRFFPHLHDLRGDVGARELFKKFPRDVCLVEPPSEYEDADIDTPEDYKALQQVWGSPGEEADGPKKTRS